MFHLSTVLHIHSARCGKGPDSKWRILDECEYEAVSPRESVTCPDSETLRLTRGPELRMDQIGISMSVDV